MIDDLLQLFLFGSSAVAIALTQSVHPGRRRWACWWGLASQPFWFWTSYHAEQWGVLALSTFYTYSWASGAWKFWIKGIPA